METIRDEDSFMAALEHDVLPAVELINWLKEARESGSGTDIQGLAELLQEALQTRGLRDKALELLALRAAWSENDPAFRRSCVELCIQALGYTAETRAMLEQAGFEKPIPVMECFRRLALLRALQPEHLVYTKTWGFGVVREKDCFDRRVTVDFENKPGHKLSFAYAAETLRILDDDHLLAIRHKQPERMQELLEKHPGEVVRILIRSFGAQPIQNIQSLLVPAILPEEGWKTFWDKARKELKKDSLFEIPRKRSEPLRILDVERGFNEHWFARLREERDMDRIIALVDEFLQEKDRPELTPAFAETLANRLAFVILGAGTRRPGLACRAALAAFDADVSSPDLAPAANLLLLLEEKRFLATVADLPAKEIRRLLDHLCRVNRDTTEELLLRLIPKMDISVLNDTMDVLILQDREADVAGVIRDLTKERQVADVEVLYWLYRHTDALAKWDLGGVNDLARWILRVLNEQHSGEKLKTQNSLREIFERQDWLKQIMGAMGDEEAREFMRRIKDSVAWDSITQRSVMAMLIKIRPALAEVVVEDKSRDTSVTARVTSLRSYYQRQDQLERIVTQEIPEVAREIGVARSYGDLSENFEYKAAKDKQALLMRRRAELEAMLAQVQPTDFAHVPCDQITQGTGVDLLYSDGRRERYYILGEWDRDEELGIISSESRMAKALIGARAGDQVQVPAGAEEISGCKVDTVLPLSEDVRTWINLVHH